MSSTVASTLYSFSVTSGSQPTGGLFLDSSGNLIGVTTAGGANNQGTVFEVVKTADGYSSTPVMLADFGSFGNFVGPSGNLVSDAQGDLFGTTFGGGASGEGSVFELVKTATGYAQTLSVVSSFNDATGTAPQGPLTLDAAGDIFGTTWHGPFEIAKTASGYAPSLTSLVVLSAGQQAEEFNFSALTIDAAGNLFGVGQGVSTEEIFEVAKTATGYANTLTILASLSGGYESTPPTTLAMDAQGDLFGTTLLGGIFEIVKTGAGYSSAPLMISKVTGYYFNSISSTLTLDQNGDIFGTSSSAGTDNRGVVFEIVKAASGYESIPVLLQTFGTADGTPVSNGVILDGSGDLVGSAVSGTDAAGGSVYELPKNSTGYASTFSPVAALGENLAGRVGSTPVGGLATDGVGNLFGTTYSGGAGGGGTVFEISRTATGYVGSAKYLASIDGYSLSSLTVDAADNLIGTAQDASSAIAGTVFEIAKTASGYASSPTILTNFPDGGLSGYDPYGRLTIDSAGDLIGVTSFGGAQGGGTVFEISKTASGYASSPVALASFALGAGVSSSIAVDAAGNLFGTTLIGGANNAATIFEIAKTATGYAEVPVTLVSFDSGILPLGPLVVDAAGDLFGVSENLYLKGFIFEVAKTASGYATSPTILMTLDDGNGGSTPSTGLIVDAAGNLFGTTAAGGAYGDGTVFEIAKTASGYADTLKILLTFDGTNGLDPRGALIAGADGTLYGTTSEGGANGGGSVFEITNSGYQVPLLTVSTALASTQSGQAVAISDSSANVTNNLASLHTLISSGTSTAITFTDATAPSISLTGSQLSSDADVVSTIESSYSLTVTGATTAGGLAAIPVADISGKVSVSDSAANIVASLDSLQAAATAGKLGAVSLSDGGIPTLSISASQLASDAAALGDLSGSFTLVEAAPATSATIVGAANALGNKVAFSGASSQYTITASGDGAHFTVSEGGVTDTLSNVQALQFSDATLIVAQTPGTSSVTTGNVAELYGAVFGRTPDVAGLAYYQQQLAASPALSLPTLAQYFLSSPEYTGSHSYAEGSTGDAQFITDSYANLLGRAPEAGAVAFYQKVIDQASQGLTQGTAAYAQAELQAHAMVLTYFSQSSEFLGDVQVTAHNPASSQHWLVLI